MKTSKEQMEYYFEAMLSEIDIRKKIKKGIHWRVGLSKSHGYVVILEGKYLTEYQARLCLKALYLIDSKVWGLEARVYCPAHTTHRERKKDGITDPCSTVSASLLGYSCFGEKVEWK